MVVTLLFDLDKNYKVPRKWTISTLEKLGRFSKGKGITKSIANSGEIPCVRYGELYTDHHNIIQYYKSFISSDISKDSVLLKFGDQLFAGSGEKKEEIGKSAAFVDKFEAYAGGDIVIFSPKDIDPIFLGYALNSEMVRKQKEKAAQGDAIVHVNSSNLKSIELLYPISKQEQQAIAEALSDVDALITSLEKLIEKKLKVQNSLANTLLISSENNDRFTRIDELVSIETGGRNTQDNKPDGAYPFFVRSQKIEKIDSFAYDKEAVLTAGDGVGTGKIFHYMNGKFDAHQRVYILSDFRSDVVGRYFYWQFKSRFYERIMSMTAKSSVDSVRREMIADLTLPIPSVSEQKEIVSKLDDAESEITLLNLQLNKAKKVKAGMMQELLTGRTRLI